LFFQEVFFMTKKNHQARLRRACREIEELARRREQVKDEEVAAAMHKIFARLLAARREEAGVSARWGKYGATLVRDGTADVYLFPGVLEIYARDGFPLPPGAETGGKLTVVWFFLAVDIETDAHYLAQAAAVFDEVEIWGLDCRGRCRAADALAAVRNILDGMRKHGGPWGYLHGRTVVPMKAARGLTELWRDWCRGSLAL